MSRHQVTEKPSWWPEWSGLPCVVAASGPSQCQEDLDYVRGKAKLIVINDTWRLAPWADILYAADIRWWSQEGKAPTADEFPGLRLTSTIDWPGVEKVHGIRGPRFQPKGYQPGGGGNGGFQAMNLAYLFKCRPVILLGFDAKDPGNHWHGRHPQNMMQTSMQSVKYWINSHNDAASKILRGEIINCTRDTALDMYPRRCLRSALQEDI